MNSMNDLTETAAIDFETYYSKEHSISELGMQGYAKHEDTDIYLVSVSCSDGQGFTGDPLTIPWHEFTGPGWTWVSHNAAFDQACFLSLIHI